MSQLETNSASLRSILEKVNSLPEAGSGSGGGASVKTCTVTINHYGSYSANYCPQNITYTLLDNFGNISTDIMDAGAIDHNTTPIVLSNVVCGSAICIHIPGAVTSELTNGEYISTYNGVLIYCANDDCIITFTPL